MDINEEDYSKDALSKKRGLKNVGLDDKDTQHYARIILNYSVTKAEFIIITGYLVCLFMGSVLSGLFASCKPYLYDCFIILFFVMITLSFILKTQNGLFFKIVGTSVAWLSVFILGVRLGIEDENHLLIILYFIVLIEWMLYRYTIIGDDAENKSNDFLTGMYMLMMIIGVVIIVIFPDIYLNPIAPIRNLGIMGYSLLPVLILVYICISPNRKHVEIGDQFLANYYIASLIIFLNGMALSGVMLCVFLTDAIDAVMNSLS